MLATILIIEDEDDYRWLVQQSLTDFGHRIITARDAETALYELSRHATDAAVVDLRLPGMGGAALIAELRSRSSMPVVVVSGASSKDEQLAAIHVGADICLTKPVPMAELDACVRGLIERTRRRRGQDVTVGALTIRPSRGCVEFDGREVMLEPQELCLLAELATAPFVVHTREQLEERVFGFDVACVPNALERLIDRLREAIDDGGSRHIVGVHGFGYRYEP